MAIALAPRVQHAPAVTPDVADMERALVVGARLIAGAPALATQLGIDDPGDIDLPPAGADADATVVRGAAALYLASELESTRLLPAVETYAALFASGAITNDLGPAAPLLVDFWRHRRDRLTADERDAFFGRAFGKPFGPALALPDGGRNLAFEPLFVDLADALSRFADDRVLGGVPPVADVAVRTTALALAGNVTEHARGMAAVAGNELLASIAGALAIVKEKAVQRAVGAASPWGAVSALATRYLGQATDVDAHVMRARTGMAVLAWLADVVPRLSLDASGSILAPNHPVIVSAIQWMQATVRLRQKPGAATPGV